MADSVRLTKLIMLSILHLSSSITLFMQSKNLIIVLSQYKELQIAVCMILHMSCWLFTAFFGVIYSAHSLFCWRYEDGMIYFLEM